MQRKDLEGEPNLQGRIDFNIQNHIYVFPYFVLPRVTLETVPASIVDLPLG